MNTKLTVTRTLKKKDNLIFLADHKDIEWAHSFFNESEISFIQNAVRNEITYLTFPKDGRLVFVQFLKENGTESISREDVRIAGNELLSTLSNYQIKSVVVINKRSINRTLDFVEGMVLGNYQFLKYFNDKADKANSLVEVKVDGDSTTTAAMKNLKSVINATCKARDLVNEPQSYLTAPQLSAEIKALGKTHGFKVTVYDKKKITSMKMGGLLAVNMGSELPPTFNILEWKPAKAKNKQPIILVGKGVVYDTGGLSLKPTANSMDFMKADMGGAATVIGTMMAAADSKLPFHLIGLIPATDNRPGKNAYAPGDVITMYSGSTVEVLNTDAEGRMILADALHFAKRYKPELVLDFATLTGAAARAFGKEAISFMGNAERKIKDKVLESGMAVYERLVELPLWREYGEQMKSNIADLKNIGGPTAGMITAGKFLEHFTGYPWLHFDLAGSAYLKQADNYRTKEGTGAGVRLMFDFLNNY